jgi:hypothetical protein
MAFTMRGGAWVFGVWLAAGCSFNSTGVTAGPTGDPPEETTGETGADTTTTPSTPTSEGSGGTGCEQGDEQSCSCPEGQGTQVCGQGGVFGPCECPDPLPTTGPGETTDTTGAVDPSTTSGETTDTTGSVDPSTTSGESTSSDESTSGDPSTTTGMMMCDQVDDEPNDDPMNMQSQMQAAIDCDDGAKQFMGTLADPGDEDWHFYSAADINGCNNGSNIVTTLHVTADAPVVVCGYIYCTQTMTTDVVCNTGTATMGFPGCCLDATADGTLDMDHNCPSNNNDSALVFVSVLAAPIECVDYTIEYDWGN